jgi:hypothetical protein
VDILRTIELNDFLYCLREGLLLSDSFVFSNFFEVAEDLLFPLLFRLREFTPGVADCLEDPFLTVF